MQHHIISAFIIGLRYLSHYHYEQRKIILTSLLFRLVPVSHVSSHKRFCSQDYDKIPFFQEDLEKILVSVMKIFINRRIKIKEQGKFLLKTNLPDN